MGIGATVVLKALKHWLPHPIRKSMSTKAATRDWQRRMRRRGWRHHRQSVVQGVPAFGACAGVWLHGAADVIKESAGIAAGLVIGEISPAARWLRNRITESVRRYSD